MARLGSDDLDSEDARLVSDLVAGVTRHRRYLDALIAQHYRGDIAELETRLRQLLRIGLYDMLLRETPAHAAVSEAVKATHELSHRGGASLVNGLLRNVARSRERGTLDLETTGDEAHDLGTRYSHPTWMVRRWLERYGMEATEELLVANNRRPTFGLRVNTLQTSVQSLGEKLDALELDWRRSAFLDDVLVVKRLQPVLRAGLIEAGGCAVQDEAAALVVRVLDPQSGERVLDGAAAPGGKAVYVAQRMDNRGEVVAVDVNEARIGLVRESALAQGVTNVHAHVEDLRQWASEEAYDRVLLDAPCSGLGVLDKRADLRWNRTEEDLEELCRLQDELLDAAARHVRPEGLLVYATCSTEPVENEKRIAAFLSRQPDFYHEDVSAFVPNEMCTSDGFYQALPHLHGTDGAFAARLRRR